jgi:hypothetical protein
METSRHPWFIFDIILFLLFNILLIWWAGDRVNQLQHLTVFQAVLLGLATFRGAHIISNEKVSQPLRAPFVKEIEQEDKTVERPLRHGFRGAMGSLLYCSSCSGVWVGAGLVYGYIFHAPITLVISSILAASAVERIITNGLDFVRNKT